MDTLRNNFVIDENGKRIGVILNLSVYEQLLDAQEELQAIKAYDQAKGSDDESIPFEIAVKEIEEGKI